MGIDIDHKHAKKGKRTETKSEDPYLQLLIKLYKFLARRTGASFNQQVLARLVKSKTNKPPVSLSFLVKQARSKDENTFLAVVGTVTDDSRILDVPKLNVVALRITKSARDRIIAAGGSVLTFDQLAVQRPRGQNTVLLRGPLKARKSYKYFGRAPGLPGTHTRARVGTGSYHKHPERARGRRKSRGFKA